MTTPAGRYEVLHELLREAASLLGDGWYERVCMAETDYVKSEVEAAKAAVLTRVADELHEMGQCFVHQVPESIAARRAYLSAARIVREGASP